MVHFKKFEDSEILLYLEANNFTCRSFMSFWQKTETRDFITHNNSNSQSMWQFLEIRGQHRDSHMMPAYAAGCVMEENPQVLGTLIFHSRQ